MGGSGSGGARVGAGKKLTTSRILSLHGGRDRAHVRSVDVSTEPATMPEGLAAPVAAVWTELAPHASAAGTLIARTVPAFLRLCDGIAKLRRWEAQIARDGDTYLKVTIDGAGQEHTEVKAHPLIGKSLALDGKITGWMKDFAINPFGKPLAVPVKDVDPFEQFG